MKKTTHKLTDNEIWKCIVFGKFKWYRKRKGGTWSFVEGVSPYWINREPLPLEISLNQVYKVERYE